MIAPILPGAEDLAELLAGKIDYVIMDKMNYKHADWVYQKYNLLDKKSDAYFDQTERILSSSFSNLGISKRYG